MIYEPSFLNCIIRECAAWMTLANDCAAHDQLVAMRYCDSRVERLLVEIAPYTIPFTALRMELNSWFDV